MAGLVRDFAESAVLFDSGMEAFSQVKTKKKNSTNKIFNFFLFCQDLASMAAEIRSSFLDVDNATFHC